MKNKILLLLHLPPPVHGSSMVGELIRKSKLINNSFNTSYINLLASKKVNTTGRLDLRKLWGYFVIILKLKTQLMFKRPVLCYFALSTTGFAFIKDAFLVGLIKLFHVPILFHLHNKGVRIYAKKKIFKFLYKFVFKGTSVILLSERLYDDVSEFVTKAQIHICPNGVPELTITNKKNKLNKSEPLQLLFLSNLIESKGVYVLLRALKLLKTRGILFKCNFIGAVGDIDQATFQSKLSTLGLTNEVMFVGPKYGENKHHFFLNTDIFVFPTYYHNEAFPLVNLEAMQYSLPIISTFEGAIPDVIEDGFNGFLVPQKDVVALADKLELLIKSDNLRLKMGASGKQKYRKEFTLDIFEKTLKSILLNKI